MTYTDKNHSELLYIIYIKYHIQVLITEEKDDHFEFFTWQNESLRKMGHFDIDVEVSDLPN